MFDVAVQDGGAAIANFDFDVSSGLIYWTEFERSSFPSHRENQLYVRRIKLDGSDYASVITVQVAYESLGVTALAINWIAGIVSCMCLAIFTYLFVCY